AAREARLRERQAAERASQQAAESRDHASQADASRYARELWDAAEARFGEGRAALASDVLAVAIATLTEAVDLYGRATRAASGAQQRERREAEDACDHMLERREHARGAGAARAGPEAWQRAEAKAAEAEAALADRSLADAGRLFAEAAALFEGAEQAIVEAR